MLNEVKHLGCVHVDVHEIDFVERCFFTNRMTIHQLFFANQFCLTINIQRVGVYGKGVCSR